MKTTLLCLALLCTVGISHAQFTAGQKMLGGQIGFNSNKSTSFGAISTNTSLSITPTFSRFVSPNAFYSVGIGYEYQLSKNELPPSLALNKTTQNTVSVFVSKTRLNRLANRFYFTYAGSLRAALGSGKQYVSTVPTTVGKQKSWSAALNGNLGLLYQLNSHLVMTCALNNVLSLNYSHSNLENPLGIPSSSSNLGFSTGLSGLSLNSITIGAMFLLK